MTINDAKMDIMLAKLKMSKTDLAEKAGFSRNRLNVLLNSKNITPKSAGRIAEALECDVTEIIE